MGKVVVLPGASSDLDEVYRYIALENPDAAKRLLKAAKEDFNKLSDMPGMGALRVYPKHLAHIRSWPISRFRNYLIFYQPIEGGIEVIRVLHAARNVDSMVAADDT